MEVPGRLTFPATAPGKLVTTGTDEGAHVLNLMELGLLGLAAYRGTQLIVWDSILDGWRKRLELWHARKHESRARTFVRALLACIYCTGFWVSVLAVLAYHAAVTGWGGADPVSLGIESFAVAGVQALLNRWDDALPGHQPDRGDS